ncbi:MAG: hypothetical protein H7645_03905 [Candidatus Heimdallarchaeota archaeon]|nr:hypothetical protein [Candidatus Heimdallarchaeota archaeon]MCK4769461.1 hypothetical protein [Candidatus Heimdallarchaeota archaeon]
MRLCSIDTTLNESVQPKQITSVVDTEIAEVKFNIIKKTGAGLDRAILEKSHILFISLPRKKITQDQYIELTSYIDIGGCLVLTLPSPPWDDLGRFFEEFRKELGISFQSHYVYGLPKIPVNTRLIGSKLKITQAHVIEYESQKNLLKERGIKKYIPLALMDDKPVILAGYKRRGRFVIFSSLEIFNKQNSNYLTKLIRLSSKKMDYLLSTKEDKIKVGDTNFYVLLQHACLDSYLLSLYHYNFMFYQGDFKFKTIEYLLKKIHTVISKQKIEGKLPDLSEIGTSLQSLKLGG